MPTLAQRLELIDQSISSGIIRQRIGGEHLFDYETLTSSPQFRLEDYTFDEGVNWELWDDFYFIVVPIVASGNGISTQEDGDNIMSRTLPVDAGVFASDMIPTLAEGAVDDWRGMAISPLGFGRGERAGAGAAVVGKLANRNKIKVGILGQSNFAFKILSCFARRYTGIKGDTGDGGLGERSANLVTSFDAAANVAQLSTDIRNYRFLEVHNTNASINNDWQVRRVIFPIESDAVGFNLSVRGFTAGADVRIMNDGNELTGLVGVASNGIRIYGYLSRVQGET